MGELLRREKRIKPLILIVEDCDDNRELYAAILERRGYDVAEAADAATALERAWALGPDAVIMDLSLPDMDGIEAIHRLAGDPRTEHTPVVVVSGDSSVIDLRKDVACWDAFLVKPCLPDVLAATLDRILS